MTATMRSATDSGRIDQAYTATVAHFPVLMGLFALYLIGVSVEGRGNLAFTSSLLSAYSLINLLIISRGKIITPTLVYAGLFSFFHLGAVWTWALAGYDLVANVSRTSNVWLTSANLEPAAHMSMLFLTVFTAVALLLEPKGAPHPRMTGMSDNPRLGAAGVLFTVVGLVGFLQIFASLNGLSLLRGGYAQFLEGAGSPRLGYSLWLMSLGACLAQLGERRHRSWSMALFLSYAGLAFPLGLRGSVLFPALAIVVTRSIRGRRMPYILILTGALGVATLAQLVKSTRSGVSVEGFNPLVAPVGLTAEMGYSLRPAVEVLGWQQAGVPPTGLTSFLAVPIRFIESILGQGPPGGGPDLRLFNVRINEWVGPIGGSPTAEAIAAGGVLGVILLAATVSISLSWALRRSLLGGEKGLAVMIVLLVALLPTVRNAFAPVIPQIGLGLILLLAATAVKSTDRPRHLGSGPYRKR